MLWSVALLAPPLVAGRIMRKRLEMQAELRDLTARLESDRGRREQRAIDSERGRIAEELQTLVANNVSAMVVQAGVVRPALAIPAPTTADTALATIEESGRDALVEMRRLLGVLRRDDAVADLAPQPSLDQALSLVERTRADGPPGAPAGGRRAQPAGPRRRPGRLPGAAGDAGLGRARRRAAGRRRCCWPTGTATCTVAVAVRDDGRGQRLLGEDSLSALRERVGLYGGTLRAGRLKDDHGFRVSARLPLEADGMIKRIRRLTERDRRAIDIAIAVLMTAAAMAVVLTSSDIEGPLGANAALFAADHAGAGGTAGARARGHRGQRRGVDGAAGLPERAVPTSRSRPSR